MSKVFEIAFKLGGELTSSFKNSFGEAQKSFSKLSEAANKMAGVGKTLSVAATAPIVGLGTAAVATAASFDDSMRKVQAISGATGDEFKQMSDLAKELGASTAFSATQASEAMSYLALAGWDTNAVMEATPSLLNLASAAGMDLAQSADIVSDVMSAFQMNATEAGLAADMFAATSSKSNTDVSMLGEALKYAGAAANAAGMDLAQTNAVLGVLADSGIKGSSAGTTMVSMLSDMKKKAKDGAVAIGETSIAVYDAQGNMRDLGTIMADVEKATDGMTTAQKDAALSSVWGVEAMKGVNIMLATGSDRYNELEGAIRNSAGTAKEMSAVMEGGIGGSLRSLSSAVESMSIAFGETLAPYVKRAAEYLAKLAKSFSSLSDETRLTIVGVAAFAAAIGPVMIAMSVLINSFINIRSAVVGFKGALAGLKVVMMANPILLVVGALAALAAGLYIAYQKSEEFRNVVDPLLAILKNVFVSGVEQIGSTVSQILPQVIQSFKSLATPIMDLGTMILPLLISVAQTIFPALVAVVQTAAPIISSLIGSIGMILMNGVIPAISSLLQIVQAVFPIIQSVIQNALTLITGIIMAAMALLQGDWAGAWEIIKSTATTIMDNIVSFFTSINLFDVGKAIITGLIDGIKSMGSAVIGAITNMIPEPIRGAASKVMGGFGGGKGGTIPEFAVGGIVDSATLAWVGEGGDTESIIPWNSSQRSKDLWLQTGKAIGMFNSSGAMGNAQEQIAMQTYANDNPAILPEQVQGSVNYNRGGNNPVIVQYNPQYNVSKAEDLAVIKEHAEKDKDDLEARIAKLQRDKERTSFGD